MRHQEYKQELPHTTDPIGRQETPGRKKRDSLALSDKIESMHGQGKPSDFLGMKNVSSGDQGPDLKYNCTDELEDALSSVKFGSQVQKQGNTKSDDLEDMVKGYFKSGRGKWRCYNALALESKLQQMSSIKGAGGSKQIFSGEQER